MIYSCLTALTERKKSRIVRLVLPSHLIRLYFTPSDEDYKTRSYSVFGGKDRYYILPFQTFFEEWDTSTRSRMFN